MAKLNDILNFMMRLGLIWAAIYSTLVYLVIPLQAMLFLPAEATIWTVCIFTVLISLILLAFKNVKNMFGVLLSTFIFLVMWFSVNEIIVKNDQSVSFKFLYGYGWCFIVLMSFQGLVFLISLLGYIVQKTRSRNDFSTVFANFKNEVSEQKKMLAVLGIVLLFAGGFLIGASTPVPKGEITIEPLNYQARFAFWGVTSHERYTADQINALNRHHVIIASCSELPEGTNESDTAFITTMKWWATNAPNVQFIPTVIGLPGGFVWDGSNGTTSLAKHIVGLVKDNNLTNVIGLSFDWEKPVDWTLGNISSEPNEERHLAAIEDWKEFFEWMDVNAPDMILSCVNYWEMAFDLVDDDYDLHIRERFLTYELPYWDEYAPMIYRCWFKGTQPYGDVPTWAPGTNVDTTYDFYLCMREHAEAVKRLHGDTKRLGVYLGITNCTCYGRDVEVWEYGEYQGMGYDMLVRDALIVKSFGAPIITLFQLHTKVENGYSMGGVFDSYGDNFLDKFNASVNGENSTKSFTIKKGSYMIARCLFMKLYWYAYIDLLYNWNRTWLAILLSLVNIAATGMLVYFNIPERFKRKNTNGQNKDG